MVRRRSCASVADASTAEDAERTIAADGCVDAFTPSPEDETEDGGCSMTTKSARGVAAPFAIGLAALGALVARRRRSVRPR